MARKDSQIALIILILASAPARLHSQVTETPIAFDSGGKVRTLTPSLAARFALKAPVWPAEGSFLEARLYSISTGGRVLAVERESRSIDRYALSDQETAALRSAIDAAMTRSGTLVTEERAHIISEPARGAFVRNQMLLTWTVYGPLLASQTDDAKTGTVLYLAATGASYFITTTIGKKTSVTRAQNHLSSDGALRGAGLAAGLLYAFTDTQPHEDTYSGVALAGALAGTVGGFRWARGLTDSEAEAATTLSNLSGLTALGVSGALGGFRDDVNGRGVVSGVVAAGLAGYALGPTYPRKARYAVTGGDLKMLSVVGLLGAAAAVTPFVSDIDSVSWKGLSAAATAGLVGGVFFADRVIARRFDYSTSDATQAYLGLAAGALLGGAAVVLTEPSEPTVGFGLVTAGAMLGTFAGHTFANPARAGARVGALDEPRARRTRLSVDSWAAALAAARVPGHHALIRVRF